MSEPIIGTEVKLDFIGENISNAIISGSKLALSAGRFHGQAGIIANEAQMQAFVAAFAVSLISQQFDAKHAEGQHEAMKRRLSTLIVNLQTIENDISRVEVDPTTFKISRGG